MLIKAAERLHSIQYSQTFQVLSLIITLNCADKGAHSKLLKFFIFTYVLHFLYFSFSYFVMCALSIWVLCCHEVFPFGLKFNIASDQCRIMGGKRELIRRSWESLKEICRRHDDWVSYKEACKDDPELNHVQTSLVPFRIRADLYQLIFWVKP